MNYDKKAQNTKNTSSLDGKYKKTNGEVLLEVHTNLSDQKPPNGLLQVGGIEFYPSKFILSSLSDFIIF